MSYILDALQRAEAERERGGVPGLHTPTGLPGASPKTLSARHRAALSTVAMLALGVVAAALWAWHAPDAVPVAEPSPPMQPAPTNALVQPVPLAVTPVSATPVARVVAPKATPPAPEPAQAARPVTPLVTTPLLSQLPEDIRRQIPALTITGAVYSDNPAQRLLLVNGQVLSQGSLAAPDLTLEHIGAANSEFSFRGTRFRLAH